MMERRSVRLPSVARSHSSSSAVSSSSFDVRHSMIWMNSMSNPQPFGLPERSLDPPANRYKGERRVRLKSGSNRSMGLGVEVDDSDRYDPLSEVLWCERGLLAPLVFKLAVVRILLVAESYRWLPNAADEAAGIADELESVSGIRRALIRQQEAS